MGDDLETVARWMIERGYATGHGDTIEELLAELDWQITENLEACADIADQHLTLNLRGHRDGRKGRTMSVEQVNQIRIRIMSEAYDLADRGDFEGYNAIKVMCSDVLALIKELLADARTTERKACADIADQHASCEGIAQKIAAQIRRRG